MSVSSMTSLWFFFMRLIAVMASSCQDTPNHDALQGGSVLLQVGLPIQPSPKAIRIKDVRPPGAAAFVNSLASLPSQDSNGSHQSLVARTVGVDLAAIASPVRIKFDDSEEAAQQIGKQHNVAKVETHDKSGQADTASQSECWNIDREYGNTGSGACETAELVGLHCMGSCLDEVRTQSWFPETAQTLEVEHKDAAACQKACLHTASCEIFVFDSREGTFGNACWMKRALNCEGPFGDAPGFISGPAKCDHHPGAEDHDGSEEASQQSGKQHKASKIEKHDKSSSYGHKVGFSYGEVGNVQKTGKDDTASQSQCWNMDREYGNTGNGACETAELVGLHCKGSCLDEVRTQSWFPETAQTLEVEHKDAAACQKTCLYTAACEIFVFDSRPGTFAKACWMKRALDCEGPLGDAPGFISGPATCDLDLLKSASDEDHENGKAAIANLQPTKDRRLMVTDVMRKSTQKSDKHTGKSQWVPWFIQFGLLLIQALGGGVCMAGAASIAVWKCTKDVENPPVCEEPRMSYRIQAVRDEANRNKQALPRINALEAET